MDICIMNIECVSGCYLKNPATKVCEIPDTLPLYNLCDFILESFDFDNDHMHEFFTSTTFRNNNPISDESVTLNAIFPLDKRRHLFMNFDFGDDWLFKISRTRETASMDDTVTYPRVIKHVGKNPEQYPMYDEYN